MKCDGSRGENIGRIKIRDNTTRTSQQKIRFTMIQRIAEEDILDHISTSFQQKKGYRPFKYCNDSNILMDGCDANIDKVTYNCRFPRHCYTFTGE